MANRIDESIVLDVQIVDGFIITQASVDGEIGNFIVDTGAPGLVLNRPSDETASTATCLSIMSSFKCGETQVRKFVWNHIKERNIVALTTDLSFLEHATNQKIDGLIGFEFLKDKAVLIDFLNDEIIFLPKESPELTDQFIKLSNYQTDIDFEGSIPTLTYDLNGKKLKLGIDSGAKRNIICQSKFNSLDQDQILSTDPILVVGTGQHSSLTEKIRLVNKSMPRGALQEIEFVLSDLSHLTQAGIELDGFIGPDFFRDSVAFFDFENNIVYIYYPKEELTMTQD